jgi:hypothetical protein
MNVSVKTGARLFLHSSKVFEHCRVRKPKTIETTPRLFHKLSRVEAINSICVQSAYAAFLATDNWSPVVMPTRLVKQVNYLSLKNSMLVILRD